jgi:hypothetical protein
VAASQCCCRYILNGEMPAENPLAGGNSDGRIQLQPDNSGAHLRLRTVGSSSVAAAAFVQRWIINFLIVCLLVFLFVLVFGLSLF